MKDRLLLISGDAALAQRVQSLLQRLPVEVQWQRNYQPPSVWPSSTLVLLDEDALPEDDVIEGEEDEVAETDRLRLPILLLVNSGVRRNLSLRLGFMDILHKDHRLSHLTWVLQEHLNALRLRRARQRQEDEAETDLDPTVFSLRHEINNPLAGILGNAELALSSKGRLSPEVRERLERIVQLTVQLRELLHPRPGADPAAASAGPDAALLHRHQTLLMSEMNGHLAGHSPLR